MDWLFLVLAGAFEIIWAVGLKYTEGFTRPLASFITVVAMIISFILMSYALRTIPMGTAYAVWTGIGACGTMLFGILFLAESRDPVRIACILGIIACVALLKFTHKSV